MRVELRLDGPLLPFFADHDYDPEDDDHRSILCDVCDKLKQQNALFLVSGFGQDKWPVDVWMDLPVLLEQLPAAIRSIEDGRLAEIDFYEQGTQRCVYFEPVGDVCVATCTSRTDWQPNPAVEEMDKRHLLGMLKTALDVFMSAFRKINPSLAEHPWIDRWLEGVPE